MKYSKRVKVVGGVAMYHCMSRVVGKEMLLGDKEKEVFRKMLWRVADFSGVEVLSYCVMSNHFHVLVKVDQDKEVSDAELLRRFEVLYPEPTDHQPVSVSMLAEIFKVGGEDAVRWRESLRARMDDVSVFMKCLKQRFTLWFNKSRGRVGTLWSERYKSVVVQNMKVAKMIVSAYIDLNPVRAGVVEDPKDYRFSTYGDAVGGGINARKALNNILESNDFAEVQREYRLLLYCKGSTPEKNKGGFSGASISDDDYVKVKRRGGELSTAELLRCRVRYFLDGAILGDQSFVEEVFDRCRNHFGKSRKTGSQIMKGGDFGGLYVARNLKKEVIGS